MLGTFQQKTAIELCDLLSELFAETVDLSDFEKLEYWTHRVLSLLERDFPVSMQVIVFNLLHHLPMYVRRFGPVYNFWMFSLERFNSWIGRRVHNRRFPESTVLETYCFFELTSFLGLAKLIPGNFVSDITEILEMNSEDRELSNMSSFSLLSPDQLKQFYSSNNSSTESIENIVVDKKMIILKDSHGKCFRYQSSTSSSSCSFSCMVCKYEKKELVFGEIKRVFQHSLEGRYTSFVLAHWFSNYHKDPITNLTCITSLDSYNPGIASVEDISKPLVHAYDTDNTLWILNIPTFHN